MKDPMQPPPPSHPPPPPPGYPPYPPYPPQYPPGYYPGPYPPHMAPGNSLGLGMSIAGLVVGIVSLLFSFIPCVGAIALWPAVLASGLSLVGVLTSRNGKGLAIAALVISLTAVGFSIREHIRWNETAGRHFDPR